MVTDDELRQIMPALPQAKRALYLPFLQLAMTEFGITTYLREAAFLAQLAHESAQFRFMEEIWGPTPAQRRYEGRRDLGNTQPGDGIRFKGRGPIQITGRANYTRYGGLLGINLVDGDNPRLAAQPEVAFRIAGLFWKSNGLNELADQQKFVQITRRINGGTNGLADRQMFYARTKKILSQQDPATRAGIRGLRQEPTDIPRNLSRGIYPGKEEAATKKRATKKAATKKKASKKASAKKSSPKKSVAKKSAAKKAAPRKSSAKRRATKRSSASIGRAKVSSAKRNASKKGALKKSAASKRS